MYMPLHLCKEWTCFLPSRVSNWCTGLVRVLPDAEFDCLWGTVLLDALNERW